MTWFSSAFPGNRPSLSRNDRPMYPSLSSCLSHLQSSFSHIEAPIRKITAILNSLPEKSVPKLAHFLCGKLLRVRSCYQTLKLFSLIMSSHQRWIPMVFYNIYRKTLSKEQTRFSPHRKLIWKLINS